MRSYKAARRAAEREAGQVEPIPFQVEWWDEDDVHHEDVFNCYGQPSSATLTDGAYFADRGVDTPEAAAIMRRVFEEAIGDRAEFRRFWDAARHIDDDVLSDIMGDVIEDTMGRPTRRPSGSSEPSSTTTGSGPTSSAASPPLPGGMTEEQFAAVMAHIAATQQTVQGEVVPPAPPTPQAKVVSLSDRTVTFLDEPTEEMLAASQETG